MLVDGFCAWGLAGCFELEKLYDPNANFSNTVSVKNSDGTWELKELTGGFKAIAEEFKLLSDGSQPSRNNA
jgi:hypothetical protein